MQFKPEMIVAIQEGRKTQTRRPMRAEDGVVLEGKKIVGVNRKGRALWRVGCGYSICPGRGKNRVGFLKITAIREEPLLTISEKDARREGFTGAETFLAAWRSLYPKFGGAWNHVWVLSFEKVG